jgi:hypothetical protein
MTQLSIHDRIMSRPQAMEPQRKPRRRWLRTALVSMAGLAAFVAAGYAAMRYDAIGNLISRPAVAETNKAEPVLADTPFLQHVKEAGIESCGTVFPALGELLTNGSQYSVQSNWNPETPDKHAVQALVGMDYATASYSGTAAGLVFATPTGAACEGAMVRVAPFSASCESIPSLLPAGSKLANNLGKVAVYALGDGGNALLLPAGNTCVVISVAAAAR